MRHRPTHVSARITVLKPPHEHGIESGPGHHSKVPATGHCIRKPPTRNSDAHPSLYDRRKALRRNHGCLCSLIRISGQNNFVSPHEMSGISGQLVVNRPTGVTQGSCPRATRAVWSHFLMNRRQVHFRFSDSLPGSILLGCCAVSRGFFFHTARATRFFLAAGRALSLRHRSEIPGMILRSFSSRETTGCLRANGLPLALLHAAYQPVRRYFCAR